MNKLVAWPDKLYACTRHWGNPETLSVFRGCANVLTFPVRQSNMQTIEYIRADLAQPQFTPEQLQSVLDALRIGEFQVHVVCSKLVLGSPIHQVMLGQYQKVGAAIALLKGMK